MMEELWVFSIVLILFTSEEVAFTTYSADSRAQHLAAKEPIPGGGSAAAYVGALAVSLKLSTGLWRAQGKPAYAQHMKMILVKYIARAGALRQDFMELMNEDFVVLLVS